MEIEIRIKLNMKKISLRFLSLVKANTYNNVNMG